MSVESSRQSLLEEATVISSLNCECESCHTYAKVIEFRCSSSWVDSRAYPQYEYYNRLCMACIMALALKLLKETGTIEILH